MKKYLKKKTEKQQQHLTVQRLELQNQKLLEVYRQLGD
jgi:hypothetical protein